MPAAAEESPAIRKLGRLFRLTEVHLWDDSYTAGANGGQKHWRSAEHGLAASRADKTRNKTSKHIDKGQSFVEDLELAKLMGSLGLPVSFSTSKVKKKTCNKGKKKGIQAPFEEGSTQVNDALRLCVNIEDRDSDVLSMSVLEHSNSCYSSGTALGHNEPCQADTDMMLGEGSLYVEQENFGCSSIYSTEKAPGCESENERELGTCKLPDNSGNTVKSEYLVQENQASDSVLQCSEEMLNHGESRSSCSGIYQEKYFSTREDEISCNFYLLVTGQAGDEGHLDGQGQDDCNELHDLSKIPDEEPINQSMITTIHEAQHAQNKQNGSMSEVLEMDQEVVSTKKKRRVRRSQSYLVNNYFSCSRDHSCQDMADNISNDIIKYWAQRYSLFSLFNSGIKMDEEGWFSVTPETIAKHHASRVGDGVMIDCFTGVGGNAIQFATKCKHVTAVDIDPQKIGCAQHNASVYGVNDLIDFIVGAFICIAPHLKGETAFMSPPWGGPEYAKVDIYDMRAMLKPCDGYSLFKLGTMIASRVVMFLPRNIDLNQLADMSLSVDPPWAVEVEKNFLNGKLKAITAYFEKKGG